MDLIYQEARCVVIPLPDVEIDEREQEFLKSFIPEYLSGSGPNRPGRQALIVSSYIPALCDIFQKISKSEGSKGLGARMNSAWDGNIPF